MKPNFKRWVLLGLFLGMLSATGYAAPLLRGDLCTEDDPDFDAYYYREQVPRCTRNVSQRTKNKVARDHGVDPDDLRNYEVDHIIPLCAGGSNSEDNLWPQPLQKALKKDVLEKEVCRKMREGDMTQDEALSLLRSWMRRNH